MKAILTADIPVHRMAVFAEMAWLERRPELGRLCRAARDSGGAITPAIVQTALPGLADAGARNVIAWCKTLGLCDRQGALTGLGRNVAETDESPVPEQGVYDWWLAEHPVIGRRVLAANRLADSRDDNFNAIQPLPIQPDGDRVFRSVANAKERFVVRDLPANHDEPGCRLGKTQATCRLKWTLDFETEEDNWRLEGAIESGSGNGKQPLAPMQHEPESDGLNVWAVLEQCWAKGELQVAGQWQVSTRRLAVPFQGLAEQEQESFRKNFTLPLVEVPAKGTFEDAQLVDVPIGPLAAPDAQAWAMARFDRALGKQPAYRSRDTVRSLFTELTEDTPLEKFSPTLPAQDSLLAGVAKDRARFWALAAPVDLAPTPLAGAELAAFSVGQPLPAAPEIQPAPTAAPHVVRVPYRGGWTMRQFVKQVLDGVVPAKLLLCDRYVRGPENLATLKLLVETVRSLAPNAGFQVWTGEEQADFKPVQSITGVPARSYREVFGTAPPHDRYLLVLPVQGSGFGLQMSNSPLHARMAQGGAGPDAPLKWKDLIATRLTAQELPAPLCQWLEGGAR